MAKNSLARDAKVYVIAFLLYRNTRYALLDGTYDGLWLCEDTAQGGARDCIKKAYTLKDSRILRLRRLCWCP